MTSALDREGRHGVVSAQWLAGALARPDLVVVEASWAPQAEAGEYLAGHIPGAVHLNTDDFENGFPTWKLRAIAKLQDVIGGLGIATDATVVVYGAQHIAVCRVWWAMLTAGVGDVRILDGGLQAWRRAALPLEAGLSSREPAAFEGSPRPEFLALTEYVRERFAGEGAWVADVRSRAEFDGITSGYGYLDAKGRIPLASHLGDADDNARLYIDDRGMMRDPAAIVASWVAAGITGSPPSFDRELIFACGSGWRSSAAFFTAWRLGYRNIRNYSDGWCGWSTRYVADATAAGGTPGWRQERTGNPSLPA